MSPPFMANSAPLLLMIELAVQLEHATEVFEKLKIWRSEGIGGNVFAESCLT
jgi:hypothetical protein